MKATEAKLLAFLKKSQQFVIPIYQRTYSWTEVECQQLWNDIIRAGGDDDISAHFIGSVVYIEKGLYQVSGHSPLLVIDGQQRLATVSLILEALARKIPDGSEPVEGFSAKKLRNYYLLNPLEDGERAYKLILTQTDKQTLLSLMEQKSVPADSSIRITENFEFFLKQIDGLGDQLETLCHGLAKLMVVDIALSRDQDNPQLIFESMNSTGRELSQADLIRNYILMGLESREQTSLYEDHWRPMELVFGQEAYGAQFDKFIRHYLTVRTDAIPKVSGVYDAFKKYSRNPEVSERGIGSLVQDIHNFAGHYCAMALGHETEPTLAVAFSDLRELKIDVAYPLLLELYQDYSGGRLSLEQFCEAIRWIESYIFRRAVCAIPTNSMNKTFANFRKALDKDRYQESFRANFLLLPSYRRFPTDDEFCRELKQRDLYNFGNRSYWLRRMENHDRKERVPVDQYTIEHIMPQNENLSDEWRQDLGEDWKRVHETRLHTIGNLTLTGYNSEYSDHSFTKKRDMAGGFGQSPLYLNEGLGQLETWNEETILNRADQLAEHALKIWERPRLPKDQLDPYLPNKPEKAVRYQIEDHKFLIEKEQTRQLFETFRTQVLALDPCVTEEFLKYYVAYKAETNFVDLIPKASFIRLTLNIDFPDLQDPNGKARDLTNIHKWGNGNVEVAIRDADEIPYAIGLVRQALEKQLGGVEIDS